LATRCTVADAQPAYEYEESVAKSTAARITWYGPSMSARSFVTARLMEAWAHGQDVADEQRNRGKEDADRATQSDP
jgi:hypothetical protein